MKKYIVLAAKWNSNEIGWDHFRLAADTVQECIDWINAPEQNDFGWAQVINLETLEVETMYSDNSGWDGEDFRYDERG